ncbi:MBL fold metallo-hydrolase [Hymenobacter properus]|uniref:MBL fold metallo-hydrolase n=1 Tax=Hymenobacter properus TaxID=2791026 RepID=A0A931BF66_9BACT|nr:MBL fold metallo-hydrolase [Hymenobacter properus]MBF9142309.1 MBL fold metallo-hydrolase [Hymenobacter properus]MBR7721116.1 MBL fold metallo-hydrolase [Microvirga sp. SRT04]
MLSNDASRADTPAFTAVVPGLSVLRDVFVNLFYAFPQDQPQGPWVLIDAGLPGSSHKIKKQAEELFGPDTPPVAILLTHGHFDHVGALDGLLAAWPDVPVYAHPLELPYLTGRSSFPPPDPTVGGGMMAYMSFTYPKHAYNFGSRVQALPADGSVPGLPGWRWVHTPGHTFGHVSFFREHDKVLVAGDAFTTVKQESGSAVFTQKQEVHGPPAYFTPDWDAARDSMALLARMEPEVAATGHGIAMHGEELRRQLDNFVPRFDELARPKVGRYVKTPATADGSGVTSVPPPLVRPWLKVLAVAGLALGGVALATAGKGKKKSKKRKPQASSQSADSFGPLQPRTTDGSYRAWYRDSPAGSSASGFETYAPDTDPSGAHANHDQRYTSTEGRKIETQYP